MCTSKSQETDKIWGMRPGRARLHRQARRPRRAARQDHRRSADRPSSPTRYDHGPRRTTRPSLVPAGTCDPPRRQDDGAGGVVAARASNARGERWLIRLADAGEVIAVPPIVPVPLTQRWFLGIANIRGNLFSVIDFAAFLGRESVVQGALARLILLSGAQWRAERRHRRSARAWPAQPRGARASRERSRRTVAWHVAALGGRRRRHMAGNRSRSARTRSRFLTSWRMTRGRLADASVNSEAAWH